MESAPESEAMGDYDDSLVATKFRPFSQGIWAFWRVTLTAELCRYRQFSHSLARVSKQNFF
jgi:hypothetical protein